jgi:hypothetical protein
MKIKIRLFDRLNQKGFGHLEAVIGIVVISLVIGVGFYTGKHKTHADAPISAQSAEATNILPRAPANYKGMWVWTDTILESRPAEWKLLSFSVANKVNVIYFSAETAIQETTGPITQAELGTFIGLADAKNIQVELLYGEPGWVTDPAAAVKLVNLSVAFTEKVPANERPRGVTFDEEPTLSPTVDGQLISLYKQLHTAAQGKLRLGATYQIIYNTSPYTYDGVTKTMNEWVIDNVDVPVFMGYRNSATEPVKNNLVYLAQPSVTYAHSVGKKVYLGVETNCDVADASVISFCGLGKKDMSSAMSTTDSLLTDNSAVGGWVVEDYTGYPELGP